MDNQEPEKKDNKVIGIIYNFLKFFLIVVVTSSITYFYTINVSLKSYMKTTDENYLSTKLSLVTNKLKQFCIYDMNDQKMLETAIKGYVAGLNDPYTQYLSADEMESLISQTTGTFVGIGVYLGNNTANDSVTVVGVMDDSEAQKEGIKAGDIISKVEDVAYKGSQLNELVDALKGTEGSSVKVEILRDDETINYEVKRSNVKVKTVGGETIEDDIAYIQIASFSDGTASEFITKYYELEKSNPKALIIDLRNNGGGVVEEALKIADYMVDEGNTLLITTNKNKQEKTDIAKTAPIIKIPVVLLINGTTASAAEILSASLKDNCNYEIVGTNSYGKGVIQTVMAFTDGSGIKITTDEYYTPNHNVINKVGIKPDIEIKPDEKWAKYAYIPYEYDVQLKKAVEVCKK